MERATLRAALAGVGAGVMLSASRAPLGLDLVRAPAVDGATAALFRAVPWILLAGLLGRPARAFAGGVPVIALLLGAALGFALEAFGLRVVLAPETRLGIGAEVLAAAAWCWLWVRRGPADDRDRPRIAEWVGLALAGAGVALALSPLGVLLGHLGLQSTPEASLRGLMLAALVWIGAAAFGPLLPRERAPSVAGAPASELRARGGPFDPARGRDALRAEASARDAGAPPRGSGAIALPALLALAAAACALGAAVAGGLAEPRALDGYLRRFGLDFSRVGMLGATALLSALILVAPGLCAGAALAAARRRVRLAAVLLGVGLGCAAWPITVDLLAEPPRAYAELHAPGAPAWPWERAALGAWVAAAGGALAAWSALRGRARAAGVALPALCALLPLAVPRRPAWILSPWHRVPIEPELAWYTGDGLLTVERDRDGAAYATVDRRRVSPLAIEEEHDALRLELAWSLLPAEVRAREVVRALLVGQVTPARAFALRAYPSLALDHTVPWHPHRAPVDAALFAGEGAMPGRAIAPEEARRRLAAGEYDLVIVPPTHGPLVLPKSASVIPWAPAPPVATAGWRVPDGTLAVAWVDAASPVAGRALAPRAILSSRGVFDLALGLVLGDAGPAATPLFATGERTRAQSPLAFLRARPEPRADRARADLCARLERANPDGPAGELARGLRLHAAAQRPSSPFESLAAQTEIDAEGLAHLARAAAAGLDPFQRSLWEGIAETLVGKRMPDLVLAHVEPIARAGAPWAELEHAVATAYRELTMDAEAAQWLRRATASAPYDIALLVEAAEWTGRAGDVAGEVELLRRADALQPGRPDLERLLAIALVRAGDPEGRRMAEEALARDPDDRELLDLLRAGPDAPRPDPLPPGVPGAAHEHEHDGG